MGLPSGNPRDPRTFEHLAKVDQDGVVVALVELETHSGWQSWTDAEGHRYVYLTDLVPESPNKALASLDIHGMRLLPPAPVVVPVKPPPVKRAKTKPAPKKKRARRRAS